MNGATLLPFDGRLLEEKRVLPPFRTTPKPDRGRSYRLRLSGCQPLEHEARRLPSARTFKVARGPRGTHAARPATAGRRLGRGRAATPAAFPWTGHLGSASMTVASGTSGSHPSVRRSCFARRTVACGEATHGAAEGLHRGLHVLAAHGRLFQEWCIRNGRTRSLISDSVHRFCCSRVSSLPKVSSSMSGTFALSHSWVILGGNSGGSANRMSGPCPLTRDARTSQNPRGCVRWPRARSPDQKAHA
jgi:hypothetical protein